MESDEKDYDLVSRSISNENRKLDEFGKEFKQYLSVRKNNDNLIKDMLKKFNICQISANQISKQNNEQLKEISVIETIDDFAARATQEMHEKMMNAIRIGRKSTNKEVEVKRPQQLKQVHVQGSKSHNDVDWKFYYFYDHKNGSKQRHGIRHDGKVFECNRPNCQCFSRVSFGMKPNSGVYKIKFKISKINNASSRNAIGISCNTHPTNNSQYNNIWYFSHDYIAWSSLDNEFKQYANVPNGLICGGGNKEQAQNIFILSKFKYISQNNSYTKTLPYLRSGDTIQIEYDSNNYTLSFSKSNDKALNSKIVNLPKHKTFYWIVGHSSGSMSVTIVS